MRNLSVILLAFLVLSFSPALLANQCTEACNANYNTGVNITFCGTDGNTYTAPQGALNVRGVINRYCYAACGISVLYVGTCGCPNDCYSSSGNGQCVNNQCVCNSGWKGRDCTAVSCPASTCSGHGSCVAQTASKGGDYCVCDAGYTAYDCSVVIPKTLVDEPYGALPYGELDSSSPYYVNDKYNDAHPFFNTSLIGTVKITSSASNLLYLLDPNNAFNQSYVDATMFFNNGLLSKSSDITYKVKGYSSRLNPKKSWNVKFPKNGDYKDLKGFSVKAFAGDRSVSTQVLVEWYRAMKIETSHVSMAELFINDVYQGLYGLQEKVDTKFQTSRYGIKDTNMYKVGPYKFEYLGNKTQTYIDLTSSSIDGAPQEVISQEEGNGDWSDIVEFITALNSSEAVATSYLQNHFNMVPFMKSMVMDTITLNCDSLLGTGNNFEFNNLNNRWDWIAMDFDNALTNTSDYFSPLFGMTGEQFQALRNSGLRYFYGVSLPNFVFDPNPFAVLNIGDNALVNAALRVPGANATFAKALEDFVKLIIVNKPGKAQQRRQAFYELARPAIARDPLFTIAKLAGTNEPGLKGFDVESTKLVTWLDKRFSYLTTRFYAYDHGTCDSNGACVCNDGYFGAACDSFCGASFTQTKSGSWASNGQQFSQWSVTLKVGASPLYAAQIAVGTKGASFAPWNIEKASDNLYTIPEYQYKNGAIEAGSSSVTFGYTIGSANAASFKLNNNACVPKQCTLAVTPSVSSSWVSGQYRYDSVVLKVKNNGSSKAASVTAKIAFSGNSYVSSSYNLSPSTSTAGQTEKLFTCNLYNLAAGSTSSSCGYTLVTPVSFTAAPSSAVSIASSVCL